ncbi:transcriptional regulator, TetR family [Lentzea albidocapillata subsp. violacea]|uniref:Transcriptional regulator, TetR family n=1 Tax=Lentzea albidocapillata subsp. violacea TaxID=128104 RepID=A0A1G8U1K5_9PSEU|nr:TetR/AcrR family transcriptional regulator [Lentzea albidocapillata]SDJ47662.1 transcriptional regulator, TetR family [Lentzea albidocapillata subsp. violacea]
MPRIRAATIEEHHEMVWADLTEAMRRLLLERDYDSITMGHIATEAGLARNTLYNYAADKKTLVLELARRASRPLAERVAAIARSPEPAAARVREIVEVILTGSTNHAMRLMFLPNSSSLVTDLPDGQDNPFTSLVAEVEKVVRDGVAGDEFRGVDDVRLTVELLSGAMRAGCERISRDPAALPATVRAARRITLATLTSGNTDAELI